MNIWPIHPSPMPDEILSSWLTRVAMGNGQKLSTIIRLVSDLCSMPYKYLDSSFPSTELNGLSEKLNVPEDTIYRTTLDSYAGFLYERSSYRSRRQSCVLNAGETRNHLYYQQYCPLCLRNNIPYYRKSWRVSFVTVCPTHSTKLLDRCCQCASPIMVIGNDIKEKYLQYRGNFTDCHVCGYDLRTFPSEPADTHVIHETNWYLSILQSGFVQLQKDKDFWIYSFSFFSLLRLMMKMTINEWSKKGNIRCESVDPDSFPIEVRYRAVQFLVGMFQDWPYRFVEYCRSWGIQYHKIKTIEKICRRVPFWIESDVQPRLYAPNVEPSEESVLAAIDLMKIQKRRVNISSVNKFMGYVDAITVRRIVKTRVYRED